MAFLRPSLADLRQRVRSGFVARLPGADLTPRRSVLGVVADVLAGLLHLTYGYLDWLVRQLIPDTAEADYLDRWCRIYGLSRLGAVQAAGNGVFAGIAGTAVPLGAVVQRADGVQFATTIAAMIGGGGTVSIAIQAVMGGANGNTAAAAVLSIASAIAGVQANVTVDNVGLTGGADQESDSALRARLLTRIQTPPQGGDAADYVTWAKSVAGVTRAWSYPLNRGAGTADVSFVMDGRANIIPTAQDVAAVQAAINAERPVTADSVAFAPNPFPLNLTIQNLTPNTAAVQAAIAAEVADMLTRNAAPGQTIYFSWIDEAISSASGEQHHLLVAPAGDVAVPAGSIAVPGVIAYT